MATTIEEALQKQTPFLMALPGVVGTAQGLCDGVPCIKVMVVALSKQLAARLPDQIEGYQVEVMVTGQISAQ